MLSDISVAFDYHRRLINSWMHMWTSRVFLVLAVVAAPFLLESSLEIYVLTLLFGPQMMFFSVVHTASRLLLYGLMFSAACLALATIFGLVCLVARRLGALGPPFPIAIVALVTALFASHIALLASYDWWGARPFGRLICVVALIGIAAAVVAMKRSASNNSSSDRGSRLRVSQGGGR
jgi:hypothetical protein